jgi:hypothetical protein
MMVFVDSSSRRHLSKCLFGNSYRLEIAAQIAGLSTDLTHAKELSDFLRIPANVVSKQLHAFVLAGVMESIDQIPGQRFRYFRRLSHPYWELAKSLEGGSDAALHGRSEAQ